MMCLKTKGLGAFALTVTTALLCAYPSLAGARATSTIWSVAGNGVACTTAPLCGDGARAVASTAELNFPQSVAVDPAGNVYTADWGDSEVRKLSPDGRITLLAGNGTPCGSAPSCGDGATGTGAQLNFPQAVAVDRAGNVYIADTGDNEIRKVSPRGVVTRVAGNGATCSSASACGDGGSALRASLNAPGGVAVDAAGNLYIADSGDNMIRKVSARGVITRVAGDGMICVSAPSCGDGGPATSAQLNAPQGLALDSSGRLYIVDGGDNEVRRVSRGTISRFAGTGVACTSAPACGDGQAAAGAQLNLPEAVAVDPAGSVYIADWGDNEIRVVSRTGTIALAAGNGSACASPPACGDAGPASSAPLSAPQGVAVDGAGNLFVADTEDHELRLVTLAGAKPASLSASTGKVSLVAFASGVTRTQVTVRYALTAAASVTLSLNGRVLARASGQAGVGQLAWNRKLGRTSAPAGRYRLTVTAAVGKASAQSSLPVRL